MDKLTESLLTGDIETASTFFKIIHGVKMLLAVAICYAYFTNETWLIDIIVVAIVLALVSPFGFFGVFIQKLIAYNMHCMEERQLLNANEANMHFRKVFEEVEVLKEQIAELQEASGKY